MLFDFFVWRARSRIVGNLQPHFLCRGANMNVTLGNTDNLEIRIDRINKILWEHYLPERLTGDGVVIEPSLYNHVAFLVLPMIVGNQFIFR